jgi:hypothetical protein
MCEIARDAALFDQVVALYTELQMRVSRASTSHISLFTLQAKQGSLVADVKCFFLTAEASIFFMCKIALCADKCTQTRVGNISRVLTYRPPIPPISMT